MYSAMSNCNNQMQGIILAGMSDCSWEVFQNALSQQNAFYKHIAINIRIRCTEMML